MTHDVDDRRALHYEERAPSAAAILIGFVVVAGAAASAVMAYLMHA